MRPFIFLLLSSILYTAILQHYCISFSLLPHYLSLILLFPPPFLTEVLIGGKLSSRQGVNLPRVELKLPAVSKADIEDLKFGVEQNVDIVFASFIQKASDVIAVREVLGETGKIISKVWLRDMTMVSGFYLGSVDNAILFTVIVMGVWEYAPIIIKGLHI